MTKLALCAAVALAAAPALAEDVYATFDTSAGKIGVKLLPGEAPKTVKSFVELAEGKREWTDPKSAMRRTPKSRRMVGRRRRRVAMASSRFIGRSCLRQVDAS